MHAPTIAYYDNDPEAYARQVNSCAMSFLADMFLADVATAGSILEIGAGAERDAMYFMNSGHRVAIMEPSPGLASLLNTRLSCAPLFDGIIRTPVEALSEKAAFDGIWCSASLLHVAKADLPDVFKRVMTALRPGGTWLMNFKKGEGERIEQGTGRRFSDFTLPSLNHLLLETVGDKIAALRLFYTQDTVPGRPNPPVWINAIVRKQPV